MNSQNRIGQIRGEIEALEAALLAKKAELQAEEVNLAAININIQTQESTLAAAASEAQPAKSQVQEDIGTDDEDLRVFAHIDGIHTGAIDAINAFL